MAADARGRWTHTRTHAPARHDSRPSDPTSAGNRALKGVVPSTVRSCSTPPMPPSAPADGNRALAPSEREIKGLPLASLVPSASRRARRRHPRRRPGGDRRAYHWSVKVNSDRLTAPALCQTARKSHRHLGTSTCTGTGRQDAGSSASPDRARAAPRRRRRRRVDRLIHEEASGKRRETAPLEEGSAQWTDSPCKTSE